MSRALVFSVLVKVSRAVTRAHGAYLVLVLALAPGFLACSPESDEGQQETKSPSQEPSDEGGSEPALELDASKPAAKDAAGGAPKDSGSKVTNNTPAGDASTSTPGNGDPAANNGDGGVAVGGDAASAVDSGGPGLPQLGKCESLSTEPCGTFVTAAGKEIPLGKYGAVMEPNVGVGFENKINASDTTAGCTRFASSFGQDKAQTDELVNLHGLDLALYTIYRPANWVEGEKYPIVSWGNGTCAKPEGYGALLRYVASQGFVVVAPNSRYVGSGNEQKHAIDFAFKANEDAKSPYYQRLDTARVAAMGHSQGSISTTAASSDPRIKTVILFNGGTSASKPFFGVSGDRDLGSPTANTYKTAVNKVTKAAYIFFHKVPGTGSADGHLTLMTQPERVTEPTVAWLKLLLSDDPESKEWFVGTSCKLCGHEEDYDFGQKGL